MRDHTHEGTDHDERQDHEHHRGNDHAGVSAFAGPIVNRRHSPGLGDPGSGGLDIAGRARVEGGGVTLQRRRSGGRRRRPASTRDRDPLAPPVRVAVVDDRAVLRRAVVPDRDVADAPVPAHRVLGPRHVVLERADDRARQVDRVTDQPVREPAEQQRALTGLGMHGHRRMLGAVDRRHELLAALEPRRIRTAAVDAHVASARSCESTRSVSASSRNSGESVVVRVHRVGPHRVAADFGDHDAAQAREAHRLIEERHVGVPVGRGRALRGVDLFHQRLVGRRLDRRVAERERSEAAARTRPGSRSRATGRGRTRRGSRAARHGCRPPSRR